MLSLELTPVVFIQKLRETDTYLTMIYTRGGCYKFALFLQKVYPTGILYIRKDHKHIVVSISNQLLDINGYVSDTENYTKLTYEDIKLYKCDKWSSERNLILCDKKLQVDKPIPIVGNIVSNIVLFFLNSLMLAFLVISIGRLFTNPNFLVKEILSNFVLVVFGIIVLSIVIRNIFVYLNRINRCKLTKKM